MYCSNACKLRVWKAKNQAAHKALREKHEVRRVSAYFAGFCACGQAIGSRRKRTICKECCEAQERKQASRSARATAEAKHRQDAKVVVCGECDCSFCPLYGSSQATLCAPCREFRDRAGKAAQRILRKARERAAKVESVNPYRVFERDGWLCRLCGVATPKDKRGTYEPDAPELDHVVPLARGGEHSYANTQCACRRCNGAKSDAVAWNPDRGAAEKSGTSESW